MASRSNYAGRAAAIAANEAELSPPSSPNPLKRPKGAEGWFRKGEEHRLAGEYAEAERCYSKALEKDRGYGNAVYGLAQAYHASNELGKAIDYYKKASELMPDEAAKIKVTIVRLEGLVERELEKERIR